MDKPLTIKDLNSMGINGLNVFEFWEDGRCLIGFSVDDKELGIARLSHLQAEAVCLNILKHVHDQRCRQQRFAEERSASAGAGEGK